MEPGQLSRKLRPRREVCPRATPLPQLPSTESKKESFLLEKGQSRDEAAACPWRPERERRSPSERRSLRASWATKTASREQSASKNRSAARAARSCLRFASLGMSATPHS